MSLKTLQEIVAETKHSLHCLTPDTAIAALDGNSDALVIDVREPGEAADSKARGSINIPRGVLEMKITNYTTDPNQPIYLYCATGGRAALAASALEAMGFTSVSLIDCSCDELISHMGED